jgi:hypothetical protein
MKFQKTATAVFSIFFFGCSAQQIVSNAQQNLNRRPAGTERVQLNCEGGGSSKGSLIISTSGGESTLQFTSDSQGQSPADFTNYEVISNDGGVVKFKSKSRTDIHAPALLNLPSNFWPPKEDWGSADVLVQTVSGTGDLNPLSLWECWYKNSPSE